MKRRRINWHGLSLQTCRNCKHFPLNFSSCCYIDKHGRKLGNKCIYKGLTIVIYPNSRACKQFTSISGKSRLEQITLLMKKLIC
jgi:hypothetical protein